MKIIIVESRKINHTSFRALENPWNFFCAFQTTDAAELYIKSTTMPGCVWYGYMEFKYSEQEVY